MEFNQRQKDYETKKKHLASGLSKSGKQFVIQKKTVSNLFRHKNRDTSQRQTVSLIHFNHVLHVDPDAKILEVEGATTFETIADATIPHGLLPLVTPELKPITIGGAIVGIGIESTSFKYGFVHDALLEADVLTPDGRVVTCTPDNEYADLFQGLPNSYGTLGYVLRAKVRLHTVKPFAHLHCTRFDQAKPFLDAMYAATADDSVEFVESLFYSPTEFYLMTAQTVDTTPMLHDIYRQQPFYKIARQQKDIYLSIKDYIFRYDPGWFWNIPSAPVYNLAKKILPKSKLNSGFYARFKDWKMKYIDKLPGFQSLKPYREPLIQDWEVPWEKAESLVEFALNLADLEDRPWLALPIRPASTPTNYPVDTKELYFNLGCYCYAKKVQEKEPYYLTREMDKKCWALSGIKMLYSSSFLSEAEFDGLYNSKAYHKLKAKYDPNKRQPTLYQKAVEFK